MPLLSIPGRVPLISERWLFGVAIGGQMPEAVSDGEGAPAEAPTPDIALGRPDGTRQNPCEHDVLHGAEG